MRLQQRYILRDRVGRGGMSEVWHAHDEVLRRGVAVKALAPALGADPYLRATARAEARAVARLNHPHITQVYDHGEVIIPDGSLVSYLVMELVDGETLAARLAAGPMPWPDATRLVGQVAGALAAAHAAGLVHRDVKPANVMLSPVGAKVLDFGIAAVVGTPDELRRVGTPAYAAPERLDNALPDPASDVYGLGALLYEAVTGRPPVLAATWAQAAEVHRHAGPPLPPEQHGLPQAVAELCLACLDPDPLRRPRAAQVAAALDPRRALTRPVRPAATQKGSPLRRWAGIREPSSEFAPKRAALLANVPRAGRLLRPRPVAALLVLAAGVVAAALLGTALLDGGDADTPDPAAAATPGASPAVTAPAATGQAATGTHAPAATDPSASVLAPAVPLPPMPGASPPPSPSPSPTAAAGAEPRAVVDLFDRELTEAAAAGRVRADVAVDLRNSLVALRSGIDSGTPEDLRLRAAELRRKLDERVAEQGIEAQTAARLTTVLSPLLSA
jgi:serine/threonine-protein kinase